MQAFGGLAPENMAFFCYGARGGGAESREEDRSEDLHRIRVLARSFRGPVKNGYACCIDFFNSLSRCCSVLVGIFKAGPSQFDSSNMSASVGSSMVVLSALILSPNSISCISETEEIWVSASEDSHSLISITADCPYPSLWL